MKTVHIHLGPHKTGSTAIQIALRENAELFQSRYGLASVHGPFVKNIADGLIRGASREEMADDFDALSQACLAAPGDAVLSCEDLAGDLPGRSNKRRPYPKLWENVNTIRSALSQFDCVFYFFVRDPKTWLRSAYIQIIKHRAKFTSFNKYQSFVKSEELWEQALQKVRQKLGDRFVEIGYSDRSSYSSVNVLFETILGPGVFGGLDPSSYRVNSAPSSNQIALLEAVNRSGASGEAQRAARSSILSGERLATLNADGFKLPDWPPRRERPEWLAPRLSELWRRSDSRVPSQDQPNLLPDPFGDLLPSRGTPVDASDEFPPVTRENLEDQALILKYRFRGLPEICFLLGLTISYLRRNTAHTEHAAFLFQRLWAEEYHTLLGTLPTRWLISSFQTFMDHGSNQAQRLAGSSAYFLSNILKAYEAERAMEGLPPDATYLDPVPTTKSGFHGMDRFGVGRSDLLVNTNALLLEAAAGDAVSGRVIQEFLLRLKDNHSVFTRMDQSRLAHDVDIPQFSNSWSFFERP